MDDYIDDSFDDGVPFEDNTDGDIGNEFFLNEHMRDGSKDSHTIGIGWEDIAMFGTLSEQIAEDEKERLSIEKDMTMDEDQEDIY
ncbi:hypothetical protein [Desulfobacterium sp. N47]|uniref:Uncharacterized protein n=1 Tax=uncultured Desulfobacterium sp. TaxID=201089 RepID=E1Y999_9BACT|nr:unknown protein [uncultured Desulfobacterium sp.]